MKIRELIKWLEQQEDRWGDIELYFTSGDGRSTWASRFKPIIRFGVIWKGNPKTPVHFLEHEGY